MALPEVRANEKLRVPAVTRVTVFMVQQNQKFVVRLAVMSDLISEDLVGRKFASCGYTFFLSFFFFLI